MTVLGQIHGRVFYRRLGLALLFLFLVYGVFQVDVYPHTTNDSVVYLDHAKHLVDSGVIRGGYRQVGYPLAIRVCHELSRLVGLDPFFMIALVQRLLLLGALICALVVLKFWSAPLIYLLTLPTIGALTNCLYIEGMQVSLALWFAVLVCHLDRNVARSSPHRAWSLNLMFVAIAALYLYNTIAKPQFIVFGLIPIAVILSYRARHNRLPLIMIATYAVTLAALSAYLLQATRENKAELGVLRPVANLDRAVFAGAWYVVFRLDSANRANPDLDEYWDGGSLFNYLHALERDVKDVRVRAERLNERAVDMLRAAGIPPVVAKAQAAWATLYCGRLNDQRWGYNKMLTGNGSHDPEHMFGDWFTKKKGLDTLFEEYNRGMRSRRMTGLRGESVAESPRPEAVQPLLSFLLVPAVLAGLLTRRARLLSGAVCIGYVFFAAVLGSTYGDFWRYILPNWVVMATIGSYNLLLFGRQWHLAGRWSPHEHRVPAWRPDPISSAACRHRRRIVRRLLPAEFTSLLEVGGDDDSLLREIRSAHPDASVTSLDASSPLIEIASRYDVIVCSEVLQHLEDWESALGTIIDQADRIVVVTVPSGTVYPLDRAAGHMRHFSRAMVDAVLAGRTDIEYGVRFWGFPWHMVFKRALNLNPARVAATLREQHHPRLVRALSRLLYGLFFLNLFTRFETGQMIVSVSKARRHGGS